MSPYPNQHLYNNAFSPTHQAGFNTAGVGRTLPMTGYDSSAMPGLTNSSQFSTNESMQCSEDQVQKNLYNQQLHHQQQQQQYNQQVHHQQQQQLNNNPFFNPPQHQGFFPQQQQQLQLQQLQQRQQLEQQQLYPFFGAQQQQQQSPFVSPPHGYPGLPLQQQPQNPFQPFHNQQQQQHMQQQFLQPHQQQQPWHSPSALPSAVVGGGLGGSSGVGPHSPMTAWMPPTPAESGSGSSATSTLPLPSASSGDSSAMPSLVHDDSKTAPNSEASVGALPSSPSRPPAVVAGHQQHQQQDGHGGAGAGLERGAVLGLGNKQQQQHHQQPLQLPYQQQQPQQQWQLHAENLGGDDPLVRLGLAPLDPDADFELTTVLNFFKPQTRYQLPPVPEYEFSQFTNRQMAFKGGNGQIRKVWWQPQGHHVILKSLIDKVVKPGRTTQEDLFNKEVLIMNRCNGHQNIVRFYGISTRSGTGQRDGERYMVMHYYEQGDLTSLLRRAYPTKDKSGQVVPAELTLSWKEKVQLAQDVALGLQHLYRNGFHHGDLHPKNVLIDTVQDDPNRRFRALLTDFGLSKVAQSNRDFSSQEVAGVWAFMAPERLPAKHPRFDVRCDIFALGVVSWQITSGHYPFGASPTYLPGRRETPVPGTPEGFVRFYQKAWSENPDDRQQSLDEVVGQLESLVREADGGGPDSGHGRSSGEGQRQQDSAEGGRFRSALSPPPQSGDCLTPSVVGAAHLSPQHQAQHNAGYPSPQYSNYSINTTSMSFSTTSSTMSTKTQSRPLHPNHPNNRPAPTIPGVKAPMMARAHSGQSGNSSGGGTGNKNDVNFDSSTGGGLWSGVGSTLSPDQQHVAGNRPRANSNLARAGLSPQMIQQLEEQRRYQQNLGQGYGFR